MKGWPIIFSLAFSVLCIAADLSSGNAHMQLVGRLGYKNRLSAFTCEIAAHPADVGLLVGLGQLHYSYGRNAEARFAFERALALAPANAAAHNLLAMVLSQQGYPKAALEHVNLAIRADPAAADAHFNRAVILATNDPPDKPAARESYKRAISLGCEPDKELEKLIGFE